MYRVQRVSADERDSRPKGYSQSYQIMKDEKPLYRGHTARYLMKPSEFICAENRARQSFSLSPSRPVMPMTWLVFDIDAGMQIGSLKRKLFGKTAWRILDVSDNEIGRILGIYPPRGFLFRFFDFFFGGSLPESYQIVSDGTLIASVQREDRPNAEKKPKTGLAGLVGRILVDKDWAIREDADMEGQIDHRLLLSGVLLLEQISRDVSS